MTIRHRFFTVTPASPMLKELMARRYEWLRMHFRFANDSHYELWFQRDIAPPDFNDTMYLDAAIDRQMSYAEELPPTPSPAAVGGEAEGYVSDPEAVKTIVETASQPPLVWMAHGGKTPSEVRALLDEMVDLTVADGVFTGELHFIVEQDTNRVVAVTGCGPKSGVNAQFLVGAAHYAHAKVNAPAAVADRGDGAWESRKLALHTVYGDEGAMAELEALIRQAARYNEIKFNPPTTQSTLRKAQEAVAAMDAAMNEADAMIGHDGFDAAFRAADRAERVAKAEAFAFVRALAAQAGDGAKVRIVDEGNLVGVGPATQPREQAGAVAVAKPKECAEGCPPKQVCDYCQGISGQDRAAPCPRAEDS